MHKLDLAFDNIEQARETNEAKWGMQAGEEEVADHFQKDIRNTAQVLLKAMKKATNGPYDLEISELTKLAKAVCDLQSTFYGKEEAKGDIIMTNQLAVFKGMLK